MRWLGFMAGAMLATLSPARAQVPPEAAEAARYSGLHAAAHRGDVTEIRKGGNVDARDAYGRTPLHVDDCVTIAAVADDEETLRLLLSLGANAKLVTSRYDGTALIAAAHLGHDGVVRQLIAAGAPLDHVNNLHWTALIEAIVLGDGGRRHQDTLRALIAAGADLQLADRQGRTPLTLARGRGYGAMVRMLEQAGAR
jgi:uncharacterized protein